MKPIIFLPQAEEEMLDAGSYYESKVKGLGRHFISEVERSKGIIVKHPEMYPVIKYAVRRCITRRYPYGLLYINDPEEIIIVAVMHLSKKPEYWVDRLNEF